MEENKKPYRGYVITVSVLLILAAICAIVLGILGCTPVLALDVWLNVVLFVIAVVAVAILVWFVCVVNGLGKKNK